MASRLRKMLEQMVLDDICGDWEGHGAEFIRRMRESNPTNYIRFGSSLLPKQEASK